MDVYLSATSSAWNFCFQKRQISLSYDKYSFKYTPSDKSNGLQLEYVIKYHFKNVHNDFGGWWQNNQVLG